MTAPDAVTRGRAAFDRKRWSEAYRELTLAERDNPLAPEDLDRLATAAYLVGQESVSGEARARAHAAFVERSDPLRAARSAFWLGYALITVPAQQAQANGWLARAKRLLDECGEDRAEYGLLLCTQGYQKITEVTLPRRSRASSRPRGSGRNSPTSMSRRSPVTPRRECSSG